ncbi:hypothetical protein D3C72_2360470 [compost metagenome]
MLGAEDGAKLLHVGAGQRVGVGRLLGERGEGGEDGAEIVGGPEERGVQPGLRAIAKGREAEGDDGGGQDVGDDVMRADQGTRDGHQDQVEGEQA